MRVRMRRGPTGPLRSLALCWGAAALLALPTEASAGWSFRFGSSGQKAEQQTGRGVDGVKAGKEAEAGPPPVSESRPASPKRTVETPEPIERPGSADVASSKPADPVARETPAAKLEPQPEPADQSRPAADVGHEPMDKAAAEVPAKPDAAPLPAVEPKQAAETPARKPQAAETITSVTYSKKRKRPAGEALPTAQGVHRDSSSRPPEDTATTCAAGCTGTPGQVVHRQAARQQSQGGLIPTSASTRTNEDAEGGSARIVCVAGCYDAAQSYAAVPSPAGQGARRGQIVAGDGAGRGRMVPTAGQMPPVRGGSGDWMARINRERAGN